MKFKNAFLSSRHLWSSPFVRWQGSLADVSSLDLAVAVTRDALAKGHFDPVRVSQIVLGTTIPQPQSFYGAPWIAARLGMTGISGPHIAQACATSVVCLVAAAQAVEVDGNTYVTRRGRRPHQQRTAAGVPALAVRRRSASDRALGARQFRGRPVDR